MLSSRTLEHIDLAQHLYLQAVEKHFEFGCWEISLVALGAQLNLNDLERTGRKKRSLIEAIIDRGFNLNWLLTVDKSVVNQCFVGSDMSALFSGKVAIEGTFSGDETAGYLFVQYCPNEANHAVALIPVDSEAHSYHVMDTIAGGHLIITDDQLAHLANDILAKNGHFEIAQLTKSNLTVQQ